ncbi:MAG: aldo/keto reductase [Bradymonadales bacterium]|nr:aldo/keto reductase [Bradymonadales bacterium]
MHMRQLGSTDLQVSAVGLGAMPLSLEGRPNRNTAIDVIHAALDAGITLIDTADVYCIDERDIGHNEALIAEALAAWPDGKDQIVVATKGGLVRPRGDWVPNGNPTHLRQACERSLKALGTDCITLYQLHAPDPNVPLEESVGALADLQQEGKIRHIGLSNVTIEQIELARQLVEVTSVQNRVNLFERHYFFTGVVDYCAEHRITLIAHSPMGGYHHHLRTRMEPALTEIARRHRCSTYQIALAWLLSLSPWIVPIPGATRILSAVSSAAAADLELDQQDTNRLHAAFPTERLLS